MCHLLDGKDAIVTTEMKYLNEQYPGLELIENVRVESLIVSKSKETGRYTQWVMSDDNKMWVCRYYKNVDGGWLSVFDMDVDLILTTEGDIETFLYHDDRHLLLGYLNAKDDANPYSRRINMQYEDVSERYSRINEFQDLLQRLESGSVSFARINEYRNDGTLCFVIADQLTKTGKIITYEVPAAGECLVKSRDIYGRT